MKEVITSGPAVNHISKVQVPINISEKCINVDVEVASNVSHTAADKGKESLIRLIKISIVNK